MSKKFEVGDKVLVNDEGLAMLRKFGAPNDNHHGIVAEIWDDGTILVEFPINKGTSEEHSQVAPYSPHLVEKRKEESHEE